VSTWLELPEADQDRFVSVLVSCTSDSTRSDLNKSAINLVKHLEYPLPPQRQVRVARSVRTFLRTYQSFAESADLSKISDQRSASLVGELQSEAQRLNQESTIGDA